MLICLMFKFVMTTMFRLLLGQRAYACEWVACGLGNPWTFSGLICKNKPARLFCKSSSKGNHKASHALSMLLLYLYCCAGRHRRSAWRQTCTGARTARQRAFLSPISCPPCASAPGLPRASASGHARGW